MYLEKYIEAASDSSSRSRRTYTILLLATILAFGTFWNTRRILWTKSWMQNRIDLLTEAYNNACCGKRLSEFQHEYIGCAGENICSDVNDSLLLVNKLLKLKDIHCDNTYAIKVDAIGVSIDVNDLGVYTSGAYCFLLMVLMYCLSREYFNLKIAFDYASDLDNKAGVNTNKNLSECYNLISMAQLWRVPQESIGDHFFKRFMKRSNNVSSLMLYIPVINMILIILNDVWTLPLAWSLSKYDTILSFSLTIVFTLIFLHLTKKCRELVIRIKAEWDAKAKKLGLAE